MKYNIVYFESCMHMNGWLLTAASSRISAADKACTGFDTLKSMVCGFHINPSRFFENRRGIKYENDMQYYICIIIS